MIRTRMRAIVAALVFGLAGGVALPGLSGGAEWSRHLDRAGSGRDRRR